MAQRPRLFCVHLLLIALLASVASADDTGADRLHHYLASVQGMAGNFRQQVIDSRGQVIEDASGDVAMQRPGRFRWDYQAPFKRVIVADGERVWLYEADLDQVTIRKLTSGIGDTPAALLTGKESVLDEFKVGKTWTEGELALVRLIPQSAEADFAGVTLGFKGPELRLLLLEDRLGQLTRIDFSGIRTNPALSPDLFRFQPPPGADVIDDSEL
jgi:outer membrane lipoprotein carrier protein